MNPLTDNGTQGLAMNGETLTSGQYGPAGAGGNANITVGVLVGGSLLVLVVLYLLGFRFAFDVSVGRK